MQTAQEFMNSWNCPDCGNSGAVYIDGGEYPCVKCEQAAVTYRKMKQTEKRMVVAVTPLTVKIDKTWHRCRDCATVNDLGEGSMCNNCYQETVDSFLGGTGRL